MLGCLGLGKVKEIECESTVSFFYFCVSPSCWIPHLESVAIFVSDVFRWKISPRNSYAAILLTSPCNQHYEILNAYLIIIFFTKYPHIIHTHTHDYRFYKRGSCSLISLSL